MTDGLRPLGRSPNKPIRLTMMLRAIVLDNGKRTVSQSAQMLRIGRPALSNVLNGKADLSVELAAKIEDVFCYSALPLLEQQAARKLCEYRNTVGSHILPVRRSDLQPAGGTCPMSFYVCARCHGTLRQGWSDAEAEAEHARLFPEVSPDEPKAILCDNCHRAFMSWIAEHPEVRD